MKIRFQTHALNAALDVASIVPPRPITPDAGPGFLFVVRGGECSIYSREQKHQIRVQLPVEAADEDGSFIFPADKIGALKWLEGWIEIEAGKDETGDRHWVRYETEMKARQEVSTLDPRLMQSLDEALDKATPGAEFPAALLREALTATKPFLAKQGDSKVAEVFQTLQVFDDSKEEWQKGNGFMFAADGIRTCHFYCDKFKGKGLLLNSGNLPFLTGFLSRATGNVHFRQGKGITFLVNNSLGYVLGWAHSIHEHPKFSYYTRKIDHFVLRAEKDLFVKALRHIRAALDAKRDKVRLEYKHTENMLVVLASESAAKVTSRPIPVTVVEEEESGAGKMGSTNDFETNLNINHLLELVEPMKAHKVEIRVSQTPSKPNRKEAYLIRTVDSFLLDEEGKVLIAKPENEGGKVAECQVTRFMPSRD